jgi:hypothetical protein
MKNEIISTLVNYAGELITFFATAAAAWLKRRYDLDKLKKEEKERDWANSAK